PHRTVVIPAAAEERRAIGNDPHPPIRLVLHVRQVLHHLHSMRFVGYPKPHRHGGQHTGLVHLVVVLVQRKRESFLVGDPEAFVHQRLLLLKIFLQRLAHFLLAGHPRQIRKRAQRLRSQPALVELRLDGQQRPAFHPAVPHAKILWPSTFIIGRFQKRISLVQAFPLLFGKRRVAALDDVVVRRNDV